MAEQQVYNKLDVALGAGYKYLVKGKRADKEDLLDELNKLGYTVVKTKEEMEIYAQKWKPYRSVATYFLWHYYLEKRGRKITY